MVNKSKIDVEVYSVEGEVFSGPVESISSVNDEGPFDILPSHANFISIIKDKLVLNLGSEEKKEISLVSGVVKHFEDKTKIYLGVESG